MGVMKGEADPEHGMLVTEEKPDTRTSHGDDDGPPLKHLVRLSEQPWDMTVVTLCGKRSTGRPSRPGAEPCPKCVEVRDFASQLDRL